MGKDLTGVRSPQRNLEPDATGPELFESPSLRGIAERARSHKQHRFRDLYREINPDFLRVCFRELNKKAAPGIDRVTYEQYAQDLEVNLADLATRLKEKRYRAKLVRRVMIPKENGKERPLGIPALEDKIVQKAAAKLLSAIFEQDFINTSYGYRPNRSAKGASEDLSFNLQFGCYGYIVEADIKGFFDNLNHDWLIEMVEYRVNDKAFIRLIRKWLSAGVLELDGQVRHPETGCPQGGIISPVLANIYLHFVLDMWFTKCVAPSCQGKAFICRYADDFVCGFQYKDEAERFFELLPDRLLKFGLEVAPEKTRICKMSRFHPSYAAQDRFTFLGFEFWWGRNKSGKPQVLRRTAPKKQQAAEKRIRDWIKKSRHLPGRDFITGVRQRLQGHFNYYNVISNKDGLTMFHRITIIAIFKWLNRRGGKRRSFTWKQFKCALPSWNLPKVSVSACKKDRIWFVG